MSRHAHVFLVEDDPVLSVATAEALITAGYQATAASSVEEAYDLLSSHPHAYDVVLLDLQLGSRRGEEIFQQLKLLGKRYPPVVILSGQSPGELRDAAAKIPATSVVAKPCNLLALSEAIDRAVADSDARD